MRLFSVGMALTLFFLLCGQSRGDDAMIEKIDEGMPFGFISDEAVNRLDAFARERGCELWADVRRAYDSRDSAALARVFQFSTKLNVLNANAKTYGQIIYSSWLNLGEAWGMERFSQVVANLSPEARQRVLDFMLIDLRDRPSADRPAWIAYWRSEYPMLIPCGYEWARDNPLFASYVPRESEQRGNNARFRRVRRVFASRCRS